MAFGDIKGFIQGAATSISTTTTITASAAIPVSVGDVIVSAFGERLSLTVTGSTDNLGNTYTAQNAGTDGGTPTGRAFYQIATSSGSLSTIGFGTPTASNDDYAAVALVLEGPFSGIDANSSNAVDSASPFAGNPITPSNTNRSVLISWIAGTNGSTAPGTCATGYTNGASIFSGTGGSNSIAAALGCKTVSSTASDTPAWTFIAAMSAAVVGGLSFTSTLAAPPTVTYRMFEVFQ